MTTEPDTPDSSGPAEAPSFLDDVYADQGTPEMAARILRAAMHLFARKGFSATSVREIVKEANVTNPMLYYYFDSKEGVFHKLIDLLFGFMEEQVTRALEDEHASFYEQIEQVVMVHLEGVRREPKALQFIYSVLFGPQENHPEFDVLAKRQQTIERLEALFARAIERGEFVPRDGFEPTFLTEQLLGVINQYLMRTIKMLEYHQHHGAHTCCSEDLTDEAAGERLLRFFFAGAGNLQDPNAMSHKTKECR